MGFVRRKCSSERGQASIMVGLMMMTFILFFGFVVNTGMLVNAKINLQNAADVAAYAGAAVQARQLNQIAFLNYEMRRQYKKFLFRYYVLGNLAQKSHPNGPGPKGAPRVWKPDPAGAEDFRVPTVCMVFNSKDNYCQVTVLPEISIPPSSPLDSINETLRGQLQALERIRKNSCNSISSTNGIVLNLWLWNTDPTLAKIDEKLGETSVEEQVLVKRVKAISAGLGLIPKEILLKKRIETLRDYVNFEPQVTLTKAKIDGIRDNVSQDLAARERFIQAFLSAYNTLGPNTFSDDSIVMDEILPSQLIELEEVKTDFETYSLVFEQQGGCVARMIPNPVRQLPIGFAKKPETLTYYAVRLKAKAKLLLSPYGELELKAYSAAQPFGSRIGPPAGSISFTRNEATPPNTCVPDGPSSCDFKKVPNLPVLETDGTAKGQGWDTTFVIGTMGQTLVPAANPNNPNAQSVIGFNEMERAYRSAMAPNPFEEGKYTIPHDLDGDPFVTYFDRSGRMAFWAPVISPDKQGQVEDEIKTMIDTFLQTPSSGPKRDDKAFKEALIEGLSNYINKLRQGEGEEGEGLNIAILTDPFNIQDPARGGKAPITLSSDIMLKDPKKVRSSWMNNRDSDFLEAGRVGYSVKFVSFNMLLNPQGTSNGRDPWTNRPALDEEANSDMLGILH